MKNFIFALSILFIFSACTEEEKAVVTPEKTEKSGYNPELAKELGADSYGMKHYVLAYLKKGPNQNQSEEEIRRLQRAHMESIKKLAQERKLVVSGPFLDDTDVRGIYIFDANSVEEVQEWIKNDPALQAGRLLMELHPWYGSAALIKTAEIHKTLSEKGI